MTMDEFLEDDKQHEPTVYHWGLIRLMLLSAPTVSTMRRTAASPSYQSYHLSQAVASAPKRSMVIHEPNHANKCLTTIAS